MVSPYAEQASSMNAEMVNLQSDQDLDSFTRKVASGKKAPRKNTKKQPPSSTKGRSGGTMEVRSRRIRTGELVYNPYFIAFETIFNLAFAFLIGLASRWVFGLIRSLRLSSPLNGYCCSPYRGGDDDASRIPGAFEKLLACVLVKGKGDDAFNGYGVFLLMMLFKSIQLASMVSAPPKTDFDDESEEAQKDSDKVTIKRIHPTKAKRFIAFCLVTLASLWMFHTPSLLRLLGLNGLTEAVEELAARIILFGNLLGVLDLSDIGTIQSDNPPALLQTVVNVLLFLLALTYGYIASSMMTPINETARNAAHVLSPSPTKKQSSDPSEMFQLMNARMMLIIQALAPLVIMTTYVFHTKFAEAEKHRVRKSTFSSNYLQNSALFLRVALSWCFVGASIHTFRTMVQSFLDQAATVASAMAALGEAGSDTKTSKQKPTTTAPPKVDPFSDRYGKIVYTAGRLAALPTFIFTLLLISHLYGGNGDTHPGVGHKSQPKNAPRPVFAPKGLLPPYAGDYMSWIDRKSRSNNNNNPLLHAAITSESAWNPTPFRDWAHNKVVDVLGKKNFCRAPEFRSVNALNRHVKYLLETDDDGNNIETVMTTHAMTGRELLDFAPVLKKDMEATCNTSAEDEEGECKATAEEDSPPLRLVLSSLLSHKLMTPTVVFPIIDSLAFLSSVWWTYWFSVKTIVYYIGLQGAAGSLQIS